MAKEVPEGNISRTFFVELEKVLFYSGKDSVKSGLTYATIPIETMPAFLMILKVNFYNTLRGHPENKRILLQKNYVHILNRYILRSYPNSTTQ
jgi:hypothetical protein